MVVVHELHHAVVEALVIGHVGVGRVDPDDLAHELGQGPAGADQVVKDVAGAGLVAFQDLLFEPGIGVGHLWLGGPAGGNGHAKSPLGTRRLVRFGGETVSRVSAGVK